MEHGKHHLDDHLDDHHEIEAFLHGVRSQASGPPLPLLEDRVRASLSRRSQRRQAVRFSVAAGMILVAAGSIYWLSRPATTETHDILSFDAVPTSYFNDVETSETMILSTTDLDIIFSENQE